MSGCTILISKEKYDNIIRYLFSCQEGYEEYSKTMISNYSSGTFKFYSLFGLRSMGDDDVNKYLSKFNARLGEVRKKYNPYVWNVEVIFKTEQDATLFVLKEL